MAFGTFHYYFFFFEACVCIFIYLEVFSYFVFILLLFYFICFLGLHPWYMEVPRLGVKSELQLPSLHHSHSHMGFDLHHSSWQCRIPHPLSKARDWTHIVMDTTQFHFHCAMMRTPLISSLTMHWPIGFLVTLFILCMFVLFPFFPPECNF